MEIVVKQRSASEDKKPKRGKRSPRRTDLPRVPPPVHDIQVNTCRNPDCENFGVPPLKVVSMGRMSLTKKERVSAGYQLRQGEKQSDGSTKKMKTGRES